MRVSTSQVFRSGVDNIQRSQQDLSRTQLQLGSGKRILSPSDDPSGAVKSLQLTSAVGKLEQYERNALSVTQRLRSTETVLTSVGDGLQRVRELVVQGNNGSQTNETRAMIAGEIAQVRDELLQLANSQDANGEYLFAGLRSWDQPFIDEGNRVRYAGDDGQRAVQISAVRTVPVGDPGQSVFSVKPPGEDGPEPRMLFDLYADVVSALKNGPDADGDGESESFHGAMGQALGDLDQALGRLLETRTSLGARMNTVETQSRVNEDQLLQVKTALSEVQDLDYAEAISRFNLQQTALQAAQQTFVQVQRLSLFNFL
ncbi:flagellar hook-associated protein FlgL [Thioalkalivibrio sp.]|uniref:flagellar hook-associated protein FlgL n=1 Tax=Thioalkalivibrio sp. TaxID=2093813 RepID=UPI0012D63688|nr:flagellar hook-associated protein FlgL [Thioalkalivibrio sp.]TVP83032.1 MAG: flagellar hook-associated protein 3 [Thioalkalivibrio sp.]